MAWYAGSRKFGLTRQAKACVWLCEAKSVVGFAVRCGASARVAGADAACVSARR